MAETLHLNAAVFFARALDREYDIYALKGNTPVQIREFLETLPVYVLADFAKHHDRTILPQLLDGTKAHAERTLNTTFLSIHVYILDTIRLFLEKESWYGDDEDSTKNVRDMMASLRATEDENQFDDMDLARFHDIFSEFADKVLPEGEWGGEEKDGMYLPSAKIALGD